MIKKSEGKKNPKGKVTLSAEEYDTLQTAASEKAATWDKYVRLCADYDNSRKMWDKQKTELIKFGNFRILQDFVSVVDEIEAALPVVTDTDTEHAKGLKMIYKKIKDTLIKEGLQVIEAKDKPFDPHKHEALTYEERDDLPEHFVVDVIQQGYIYGDKVLRPARVKVSVKPQSVETDNNDN